jgi:hypothetical protein
LLAVMKKDGDISISEEKNGLLAEVYKDGKTVM